MSVTSIVGNLLGNYSDDIAKAAGKVAATNTDDLAKVLAKSGVSKGASGRFIASGERSLESDKGLLQTLKKIAGADNIDDGTSYFMSHRPTQTGIYADDLTKQGFEVALPKDIYDNPQYYTYMYGETPDVMNETMAQLNAVRGNPNGQVNIYRATTGNSINDGDWITLSPTYAKNHLRDQLGDKGRVVSQKVNVRDIQHAGDDLAEWGFYPRSRELPENVQNILSKLLGRE
jgi:hypothetical protein